MTSNIAINGFGRIGRLTLRAIIENNTPLNIVAINDIGDAETCAHLLKYDSVHGKLNNNIIVNGNKLIIDDKEIIMLNERNPENLPWKDMNIDIVLECTGIFTDKQKANAHIKAGATKVIVSAPAKDADATIVFGVNHTVLKDSDTIISNASCTTNCLAPVAQILHEHFHITNGFMTTIHSYTGDQQLLDGLHKDLQRARAANLSMVPSTTGAAKSIGLVLPALKGLLDGTAVRVPTPNVSLVNLVVNVEKIATIDAVNSAFTEAANGRLKNILAVNEKPLTSIDFNHAPESSIIDVKETYITNGNMVRVLSWYDNEWGFSNRMIDLTQYVLANFNS